MGQNRSTPIYYRRELGCLGRNHARLEGTRCVETLVQNATSGGNPKI